MTFPEIDRNNFSISFHLHITSIDIRQADGPNGVLDPGSEGPISDLAIFLCAISFSL